MSNMILTLNININQLSTTNNTGIYEKDIGNSVFDFEDNAE